MKKRIKLHNKNIDYRLRISKRAKRMRLTVYCDGAFVVTKPIGLQENIVEKYIIQKSNWIIDKIIFFKKFKNSYIINNDEKSFVKNKDKAFDFVYKRINYFNKKYKFRFNKINIKNQKTRWGSCSKKGNLNFNFKILFLQKKMADYIIIHELCHLKQFNHSRKFWNLLAKIMPDYLEIKNELKSKGLNYV